MGIIHYLFIAGQEDENAYLPAAHKNAVSHYVTIWTVKDKPHHNFSSKCLIKGTLILSWNVRDITKTSLPSEQIVTA